MTRYVVVSGEGFGVVCNATELVPLLLETAYVPDLYVWELPEPASSGEWGEGYLKVLQDEPMDPYVDKAEWVQKCIGHVNPILDLGAGIGRLQVLLEQQGYKTVGVEVNSVAMAHNPLSCILFDGYKLPFPDDAFAAVVSMNVFEHLEYEHACQMALECMRVAPRAFISLQKMIGDDAQFVFDTDPTHKVALSEDQWVGVFESAGAVVESFDIGKPRVGSYRLTRR